MSFVSTTCEICHSAFEARQADLKRGRARFCSLRCSGSRVRTKPNVKCESCDAPLHRKPSRLESGARGVFFCSRICMDNSRWRSIKPREEACVHCSKKLTANQVRFCNSKCQQEFSHSNYITRWLAGLEHGMAGEGVSAHIRRWMFEKHDSRCQECGWSKINPTTGKIPLCVDHKDGDHRNNRPENLRLLCPCCHSLTPNYGNLNRGKGRPKRLKKIREKKLMVEAARLELA